MTSELPREVSRLVQSHVWFDDGSDGGPLYTQLRFSEDNPWEVTGTLVFATDLYQWRCTRSMLQDGLRPGAPHVTGEGLVQLWTCEHDTFHAHMEGDGEFGAVSSMEAERVRRFLRLTCGIVPWGREPEISDEALARFVGDQNH